MYVDSHAVIVLSLLIQCVILLSDRINMHAAISLEGGVGRVKASC